MSTQQHRQEPLLFEEMGTADQLASLLALTSHPSYRHLLHLLETEAQAAERIVLEGWTLSREDTIARLIMREELIGEARGLRRLGREAALLVAELQDKVKETQDGFRQTINEPNDGN